MSDQYDLTWSEASALVLAGTPVRRFAWTGKWIMWTPYLWMVSPDGVTPSGVVRAADFGAGEFLTRDWTTSQPAAFDVCSRAAATVQAVAPFSPPAVTAEAALSGGNLVITALLGAGTYGSYWLTFYVNGAAVYADGATEAGIVTATVPAPGSFTSITVRAESVLPAPAWRVDVAVPLPVIEFYTCGLSSWYADSERTRSGTYAWDGSTVPSGWRVTNYSGTIQASGGYFVPTETVVASLGIIAGDFTMAFKGRFSDTSGTSPYYNNIHAFYVSKDTPDAPARAYGIATAPSNYDYYEDPSNCLVYICSTVVSPLTTVGLIPGAHVTPDQGLNVDYDFVFARSGSSLSLAIGDQTMSCTLPSGVGCGELRLGFWYDTARGPAQVPMIRDLTVTV